MDIERLREQFPALSRLAYFNAGTDGPLAAAASAAAIAEIEREGGDGRGGAHFQRRAAFEAELREQYATALACSPADVSLTTCTSEGLAIVIGGLKFARGEEILTSDEEHPGLLGCLAAVKERDGVSIKAAPLRLLAESVTKRTAMIACSHVSWMTGASCPEGLFESGVPVVLDGAQGVGAVEIDIERLGCDAYAGPGQKWLCGPDGTGMLYVSERLRERVLSLRRGYGNFVDPHLGLDAQPHPDGRRFDTLCLNNPTLACALAATKLCNEVGLAAMAARARELANVLRARLIAHDRKVVSPLGATLVCFHSEAPAAERDRLAAAGVIVRDIPDTPWLRASVGAWNDEHDIERLLNGLS